MYGEKSWRKNKYLKKPAGFEEGQREMCGEEVWKEMFISEWDWIYYEGGKN